MTFSESVRTVLFKKYATFSGRASRSEYWWWMLLVTILMGIVAAAAYSLINETNRFILGVSGALLVGILAVVFIPNLAVTTRRWHDVNISGWWLLAAILIGVIPVFGIIGGIAMFIVSVIKGTEGSNNYGADPLAEGRPQESISESTAGPTAEPTAEPTNSPNQSDQKPPPIPSEKSPKA